MAKEYIEREALLLESIAREMRNKYHRDYRKKNKEKVQETERKSRERRLERAVAERLAKIDAAPVAHGRWEDASDLDGIVCSVCGEDFCVLTNETERFNYCPNCGARMDGE